MELCKLDCGIFARNPKLVRFIIIHCSATPRGRDVTAADIRAWHLKRGFRDIGYHFVVRLDGTIERGRPLGEPGAHCSGKNNCSVSICYVGGVEKDCVTPADTRTDAQKRSIAALVMQLRTIFPDAEVRGHRDFAPKACPSFDAMTEYRQHPCRNKTVMPLLLLPVIFATAGCRSKHTVSTVNTSSVDVSSTTSRISSTTGKIRFGSDSLSMEIFEPVFAITTADSTVGQMSAKRISIKHGSIGSTISASTGRSVDTILTASVSKTVDNTVSEARPAVPATAGWTGTVIAVAALAVLFFGIRKLIKNVKP